MVTITITKHDRNDIVIGDFHNPKTGNPVSAVMMAPDRIYLYSSKWIDKHVITYVPSLKNPVDAIMEIVAEYTDSDVYIETDGQIITLHD